MALRTRLGLSMAPAEDDGRAHALDVARTALGPPRYGEAYAEGAAMSLDQAIAYALRDAEAGPCCDHHPRASLADENLPSSASDP